MGRVRGDYYLEHPDRNGYRRVSEDALTLLRGLAAGDVSRADSRTTTSRNWSTASVVFTDS